VAIGWPAQRPGGFGRGDAVGPGVGRALPDRSTILAPPGGSPAVPASAGDLPVKIVTWLILPVVICLSQRLSHACPSISNLYGETANGSLNQLSFI